MGTVAWVVMTVDDLADYLDANQLDVLRTAWLQGGPVRSVTLDSTLDTVNRTAHGFVDGTKVILAGNLPPELIAGQTYYVVTAAADSYQLAATLAGSPIDFTSNGSDVQDQQVLQADPFTNLMSRQAARVRTNIKANPRNALSATANSVPPECVWILSWLILEVMSTRIPQIALKDDQKQQLKDAKQALLDIRKITEELYPISAPTDPEPDPAQTIQPTTKIFNRTTTELPTPLTTLSLRGL